MNPTFRSSLDAFNLFKILTRKYVWTAFKSLGCHLEQIAVPNPEKTFNNRAWYLHGIHAAIANVLCAHVCHSCTILCSLSYYLFIPLIYMHSYRTFPSNPMQSFMFYHAFILYLTEAKCFT